MNALHDALAGSAELIGFIEQLGNAFAGHRVVTTVGRLEVDPGLMTVVPGQARLSVDVRSPIREQTW